MKQRTRGVGVGTISLVMIFAVLCLTVFAMLTLSSANAEKTLSDRTSSFVTGYYAADSEATKIRAAIADSFAKGALPESIEGTAITYERSGDAVYASFSCSVNDVQDLLVKLELTQGKDTVLEWKTGYAKDWNVDNSIVVWDFDSLINNQ